jgi:hypothetical protein
MTKPRRPSPASTHTRERLDRAFQSVDPLADREKLRQQSKPKPAKVSSLLAKREAVMFEPLPDDPFTPEAFKDGLAAAVVEIAATMERVKQSRARTIERSRFSTAYQPRREVETESLDRYGEITRQRVVSPFTLPQETRNRIELAEAAIKESSHPEPSLKPTRLDHVLEERERYALAKYIEDRSTELEGKSETNGSGLAAWRPAPLTDRKGKALDRIDFIHRNLNPDDKHDLEEFTRMCLPIDDRRPKTIHEFGASIIKFTEKTVAEGAFLATVRKIAQRIAALLRIMDVAREISGRGRMPQLSLEIAA